LETNETLKLAYGTGREKGVEKVLQYIDNPIVRYTIPV